MRPEAKSFVTKGGRELTFLFNHRGIITAEKAADAGFGELLIGMSKGRLGYLCALIQGGLSVCHPEITGEDSWDLMENEGEPLAIALGEALQSAMPKRVGKGENPPKAGRRGTGTLSSPSGSRKVSTKPGSSTRRRAASQSS